MTEPPSEKPQMIGEYQIIRIIGSGTTWRVALAQHSVTQKYVAIKILKKVNFEKSPPLKNRVQREIALMRLFDHPHLLKLIEVCESPRHLYVVVEYASNGEVFTYLSSRDHIDLEFGMRLFRQLIYGLEFLHSHAICHRDIKPENLLLDEHSELKIADFGFARWMRTNIAETACGSPHYAAPEVVRGIPYDGRGADIWSCGVVLYAILSGRLPFNDPAIRNLLAKVKAGQYQMPQLPEPLQDLISRMLIVDPSQRITIGEIKEHRGFRWGLPEAYVFPTPIPTSVIVDAIDPQGIDPSVVVSLRQIGFLDDQELWNELATPGHTMAKVFYSMLTESMTLEKLPWSQPEVMGRGAEHAVDAFMFTPGDFRPSSFELPNASSFGFGTSLSERVPLPIVPTEEWTCDVTQPFLGINLPREVLLMTMQVFLTSQDFEWFHPDDFTIVARRSVDVTYVIIKIELADSPLTNMIVYFQHASQETVGILIEGITWTITQTDQQLHGQ